MSLSSRKLQALLQARVVAPLTFSGTQFFADGRGCLYDSSSDTLIVSDLHFGKSLSLNRYANFIPSYDINDTLERLSVLISCYQPERLVALGDSFHDRQSHDAVAEKTGASIEALCNAVANWIWIMGNHDDDIDRIWPGDYQSAVSLGNIVLRHEPLDIPEPQIVGHFHPKFTAKLGAAKVRGESFLRGKQLLVMPAFGSYTGGMEHNHPDLLGHFDGGINGLWLCAQGKVFNMSRRL